MLCIPLIAVAAGVGYFLFGNNNHRIECCIGGIDFNDQCWLDNPVCYSEKKLCYEQCMVNKGHKCWRKNPELVAVNFLNNDFIDCDYRDSAATVCEYRECCDKAFVVLSFPNCKKMAFELFKPIEKGNCGIWVVKRYAYV